MDFTVEQIITTIPKPFIYVDFNELLDKEIVMLSQTDSKNDYLGNAIALHEGLEIIGYQEDEDISGARDDILMEGVCILNQTGHSEYVKWLLKANNKGIRYASDIVQNGW